MHRDSNPTTRCYPRRLEEAFDDPVQRAQWFFPPERSQRRRDVLLAILGIALWALVAYLMLRY